MQSEPRGPWWERTRGGDFPALAPANDGSGRVAPAGAWFHYSNLGYGLLGEVVARRFGTPWRALVSERLLQPLGMRTTSYLPRPGAQPGWSVDHFTGVRVHEPLTDTGAMAPAGQLWSTLADLVTWGQALGGARPDVLATVLVGGDAATRDRRLRARADAGHPPRWPAGGAQRLDARLPGRPPRRSRQRHRGGGARQRDHGHRPARPRRVAHRGRPRCRGLPAGAVAPDPRGPGGGPATCRGCGSGATPPTTCAGTTTASRCGRWRAATSSPTASSSCRGRWSASWATTAASGSTSYAVRTGRSATSSARPSSTPALPYDPEVGIPGGHP